MKKKLPECERIFASYSSDRGLIPRLSKELKKNQGVKKANGTIRKWAMNLNTEFSVEEIKMD